MRELGAIGAAQNVPDRLHQAGYGPQGDNGAEPQKPAAPRRNHIAGDGFDDVPHHRRQGEKNGVDRGSPLAFFPHQREDRRAQNEEGKDRKHRQIGKVSGMNETVVERSDGGALDDFPRLGTDAEAACQEACRPAFLRVEPPRLG